MGEVFRAEDLKLRRPVALKVLRGAEDQEGRLLREARFASQLNHPNIAVVYDVDTVERDGKKQSFIAMEYVDGAHAVGASQGARAGRPRDRGDRPAGRRRPRGRACARGRPSRRQARKRHGGRQGAREGPGLRPRRVPARAGRGERDLEPDRRGPDSLDAGLRARDRRVHVARAGPGPRRRRAHRRLLAGRPALGASRRPPALRRREHGRRHRRAAPRGAAFADAAQSGRPAGAGGPRL